MGIKRITVFGAETITKDTTEYSAMIDLATQHISGLFGLQITVTGDGTLKGRYAISNNKSDYIIPAGAADIFTDFTSGSGPGLDGKGIYTFAPKLGRYMKIAITETVATDDAVITAELVMK